MNVRRLLCCMSLLATLALAPAFALGQTDGVRWRSTLDAAKIEAAQTGRLVLIHFWSPSCGPCRKLENTVFHLPQVGAAIEEHYVPVKVNVAASSAMAYAYKVNRVPSDVIITSQGNVLANYTSPATQQDYLGKLSAVNSSLGPQQDQPFTPAGGPQVNTAYAAIQKKSPQSAAIPVSNPNIQAFTSNRPATSSPFAATPRVDSRASQPSQPTNRYATPASQNTPQKKDVPGNAMPNSYRNPYLRPSEPSTAEAHTTASASSTSRYPAATNTAILAATANAATRDATSVGPASKSVASANRSAVPAIKPVTATSTVQLPAGSPSLGFEGYCPITLKFDKKWVRGDVQFGAIHRGRTYLFVGDQQRQQFLANPDAYSPVFSGMDPVILLDNQQMVEGSRKFGFEYRGTFYLFSSSESMKKFASQPDHYATGVRQAMTQQGGSKEVLRR
jgi:YHS domain-containing protein/thiol-disulfide isomerase/thioredoxin